jgi:predicted Zn-dependent peptidase
MKDYEIYTFPNGIRIVHKQVTQTKVAHCGFVLDIGSRDELPEQLGIAHFWEHMAFKGTKRRRAFHILNRLESVGGELNAYTTKEKICFYASFLDKYYEKAAELLTDITFDSVFPEREIEKERGVILEEMSMYIDAPDDAIQDDFDEVVFGSHPLGNNILGTTESVRRFQREDFQQFIAQNLNTERVIFASIGDFTMAQVVKMVERFLSPIPACQAQKRNLLFDGYEPKTVQKARAISQAHCMLGRTAYAINDDKKLPFFMLVNLLGGPGMNSRLNLALREKYGFVYSVEGNYASYIDTGLLSIYFATEKKQLQRSIGLVQKELKKLREVPLGTVQLHSAKEQLMGQMAMAEESNISLMLTLGKGLLDTGKVDSLNDIFKQVQAIKAKDLQDIANEMFDESQLSYLTYLPE